MKNQVELKMAYCYHSYFTYYSSHFVTPIMNHNDDKVNNDPNVSQNYKNKLKVKMMISTNKLTRRKVILKIIKIVNLKLANYKMKLIN